jgi:hypothetical protein
VTYTDTVVNGVPYHYWQPTPGTPGLERTVGFRGPGTNDWDMALQKSIPIKERLKVTLRAEAYNIFNHPSFNGVGSTLDYDYTTSGNGALKSTSSFGQVSGERGPRILQLSGRVAF